MPNDYLEHRKKALGQLELAWEHKDAPQEQRYLAAAQVHATLANAAAVALLVGQLAERVTVSGTIHAHVKRMEPWET